MKALLGTSDDVEETPEDAPKTKDEGRSVRDLTAGEIVAELEQVEKAEVATIVTTAGRELARRTQLDECRHLEKENSRLKVELECFKREMSELKAEMKELRRGIQPSPIPTPPSPMAVFPSHSPTRKTKKSSSLGSMEKRGRPPPEREDTQPTNTVGLNDTLVAAVLRQGDEAKRSWKSGPKIVSDITIKPATVTKGEETSGCDDPASTNPQSKKKKKGKKNKTGAGNTVAKADIPFLRTSESSGPRPKPLDATVSYSAVVRKGGTGTGNTGNKNSGAGRIQPKPAQASGPLPHPKGAGTGAVGKGKGPKRTATGGILYEIPGAGSAEKADKLVVALKALLEPKGLRVTRLVKRAELRISGLDDVSTPEDVIQAVAEVGGCSAGDIKVEKINRAPVGRLGSIWVQCPALAAKKDLLTQTLAEWRIELAVAAEPYYVSTRSTSLGDVDGSVVIIGNGGRAFPLPTGEGQPAAPPKQRWYTPTPRWALKRLDKDTLMAAAVAKTWESPIPGPCNVNGEAAWFREAMTQICDVAMPRIRAPPSRKSVYWWTQDIAQLRIDCVRTRHRYTRCRRRRHTEAEAATLYEAYREVKKSLQRAIKRAKTKAWDERQRWTADLGVTKEELARGIKRLGAKNTAPGSDGIPGRAWVLALSVLGDRLRRALSEGAVSRGGVALVISLDIANAFNTLPWECIRRALEFHRVPPYIRKVVGDYLKDRCITYLGRYKTPYRRETNRRIPQGSVLGPLLWNLGYDWVLRGALLTGLSVVCVADDTLVMARGDSWEEAVRLARVGGALVVGRIRALGFEVALHKTEAMFFIGPRRGRPPQPHIEIEGVRIEIRPYMKYLGLYLDCRWCFKEHFCRMAPRIRAAVNAFDHFLPNIEGPKDWVRRLYMGVVGSMILYGAPDHLRGGGLCGVGINTVDPTGGDARLDVRVACRSPPAGGNPDTECGESCLAPAPAKKTIERWKERLADPRTGHRAVGAIQPVLAEWLDRRHGGLSYRLVQVLTGHGCFGEYLHKVARREPTTKCHHCEEDRDTAQHTLEVCPAWEGQHRVLVEEVGKDLSLPAVVEIMVRSREAWRAMVSFCEYVISQKKIAERERENGPDSAPVCRRRGGAGRRAYARIP
ncbi:reverse transcriptase [Lasius niger]|uniref:Reverse transcriptase n=1 Tax=Lasius niger TaxID=67767 RepID=A0A0J7KM11_LASNI|nr:reverse transcriptase [Lasius niger]